MSPVTTSRQGALTSGRAFSSRPQASSISSIPLSQVLFAPARSRSPAIARFASARFSSASVRSSGHGQSAPVGPDSPHSQFRPSPELFLLSRFSRFARQTDRGCTSSMILAICINLVMTISFILAIHFCMCYFVSVNIKISLRF